MTSRGSWVLPSRGHLGASLLARRRPARLAVGACGIEGVAAERRLVLGAEARPEGEVRSADEAAELLDVRASRLYKRSPRRRRRRTVLGSLDHRGGARAMVTPPRGRLSPRASATSRRMLVGHRSIVSLSDNRKRNSAFRTTSATPVPTRPGRFPSPVEVRACVHRVLLGVARIFAGQWGMARGTIRRGSLRLGCACRRLRGPGQRACARGAPSA